MGLDELLQHNASDLTSGTVPDGRVAPSSVEQHEVNISTDRTRAIAEAERIRRQAGVPDGINTGIEPGVSAGLSDSSLLSGNTRITVTQESDASSLASSGSGSEGDPYIIRDLDLNNSEGTSSTGGFVWNDTDADYYIQLFNCQIRGYDGKQVGMSAPTRLEIVESKIWDPDVGLLDINLDQGEISCKRTHFAQVGSNDLTRMFAPTTDISFTNCLFDNAEGKWTNSPSLVQNFDAGGSAKFTHCELNVSNVVDWVFFNKNCHFKIDRCFGDGQRSVLIGNKLDTQTKGVEVLDSRFINGSKYMGDGVYDGLTVKRCYFGPNGAGSRMIFVKAKNATFSQLRFKKIKGSGPGNECLEVNKPKNVTFKNCWVEECTEDAYEMLATGEGCEVKHCVADNATGQIVDFFGNNEADAVDAKIHHIYGDTQDTGVIVTDVSGVTVRDIYCKADVAVEVEQRKGSTGQPNHVEVLAPLPLDGSVNTTYKATGTLGSDIVAIGNDGQVLSGSPNVTPELR